MKLISALFFLSYSLYAQSTSTTPEKQVNNIKLLWIDFVETVKFDKKWTLQFEYNPRFTIDPTEFSQNVMRTFALCNVGENWNIGQGFGAFFINKGSVTTHELRSEQWFFYKQQFEKAKRLVIAHRFKAEERFTRKTAGDKLADGYYFTMRYRYRLGFDYTLVKIGEKENPLKYFISDEIFLQSGKTIVYNVFDQNRIYTGFSYKVVKGLTVSVAYMNVYQQKSSGNSFDRYHTFRVGFQHELAVKNKKR